MSQRVSAELRKNFRPIRRQTRELLSEVLVGEPGNLLRQLEFVGAVADLFLLFKNRVIVPSTLRSSLRISNTRSSLIGW